MNPFVSLHAVDAMCFDVFVSRRSGLFISIRLSFVAPSSGKFLKKYLFPKPLLADSLISVYIMFIR